MLLHNVKKFKWISVKTTTLHNSHIAVVEKETLRNLEEKLLAHFHLLSLALNTSYVVGARSMSSTTDNSFITVLWNHFSLILRRRMIFFAFKFKIGDTMLPNIASMVALVQVSSPNSVLQIWNDIVSIYDNRYGIRCEKYVMAHFCRRVSNVADHVIVERSNRPRIVLHLEMQHFGLQHSHSTVTYLLKYLSKSMLQLYGKVRRRNQRQEQ